MQQSSSEFSAARYARQLSLPGFGVDGQRSLARARVLVIGAGGLGSVVLPPLAAAGVGTIGIIDDDIVETSNLHRQYIHSTADVGALKVSSAAASLRALNPDTTVIEFAERLTAANALHLFGQFDLIIDGSDNFPTRYLANDAAALSGLPLVWGAVSQYAGQAGVSWAGHGPQYRDLFPEPPAPGTVLSCAIGGVLPTVCAVIGSILATEAIKILTRIGEPLLGRVTTFDALTGRFRELSYAADPTAAPVTELIDYDLFCGIPAANPESASAASGSEATVAATLSDTVTPSELAHTLEAASTTHLTLLDVREPWEVAIAALPGAVVIPLGSLDRALEDGTTGLDQQDPVIVYCHHGVRSATALDMLVRHGFTSAQHLAGGIDAYSRSVDPSLERY
ncbi:MAG TPA: ThiF family adenylyltransferase [Glaciihabitans sp.]|jgi:adenylyltransferase/sulfurtransferase|nr:ThiF family adenylyltransferase [Glaciihabitans sp.]